MPPSTEELRTHATGCCARSLKYAVYGICFLIGASSTALALSFSTAEGAFARHVSKLAEFYSNENEGRSPSSWSDLEKYCNSPIDAAYRDVTSTKRYAFLSKPLSLPRPYGGELVIITRRPFRDGTLYTNWFGGISEGLREPGRYIIYRTADGAFHSAYVDEGYVQKAFRGFESLLPEPDTEPLRRREMVSRLISIIAWVVAALIVAAFVGYRIFSHSSKSRGNARKV